MSSVLWIVPFASLAAGGYLVATSAPLLLQRHRIRSRLVEVQRHTVQSAASSVEADLLRNERRSMLWKLLLSRFPTLSGSEVLLRQAGIAWPVERYLYARLALVIFAAFFFATAFGTFPAVVAAVAAVILPVAYVKRRRSKRLEAFEEQLPGAIELMARALRAGHPLVHGMEMVGQDTPEPLASEFRLAYDEHRFGMPLDETMLRLADRLQLPDARILITAILVQRDAGGNIAEVFYRLAQLIRERAVLNRQVRIHTAQGRMSGYMLSAMPAAFALILLLINPSYILTLVHHPVGRTLLMGAAVMQIIGHLWIQKIVKIDV